MSRAKGPEDIFEHDYLEFYRSDEFREHVEQHERKPVSNYIRNLLRLRTGISSHPDVDYVTNGVLCKVYISIDERVSGAPSAAHRFLAFRKFLYTIARRDTLDHARKELTHRGTADYEQELERRAVGEYGRESGGEGVRSEGDSLAALKSALSRLSPLDRLALLGSAEGRPYRDLAEEFGCSEAALRVRCSRARNKLRDLLRSEAVFVQRGKGRSEDE